MNSGARFGHPPGLVPYVYITGPYVYITGIPGSGKTTQAMKFTKNYEYKYFSSGELAREIAFFQPEIFKCLKKGELPPIDEEIQTRIRMLHPPLVIDGFPRTTEQYRWIKENFENYRILIMGISRREAYSRLQKRKRPDGVLALGNAFKITVPFISDALEERNPKVIVINAEKRKDKIWEEIRQKLQM